MNRWDQDEQSLNKYFSIFIYHDSIITINQILRQFCCFVSLNCTSFNQRHHLSKEKEIKNIQISHNPLSPAAYRFPPSVSHETAPAFNKKLLSTNHQKGKKKKCRKQRKNTVEISSSRCCWYAKAAFPPRKLIASPCLDKWISCCRARKL